MLIVSRERGPRSLLRAELRETGYDAIGASSLATALRYPPASPDRGPVRLVILDRPAAAPALRDQVRARYPETRVLLLTGAIGEAHGAWDLVLRRPLTIGEIVAAVQRLVPLPPERQAPLDR